jgi:multidrug efflux pump subunit AcrB
MASRLITPLDVERVLRVANVNIQAGALRAENKETLVESGSFVQTVHEAETLVVGVFSGRPVYLRDVARVIDGPEEQTNYTRISFGPGEKSKD